MWTIIIEHMYNPEETNEDEPCYYETEDDANAVGEWVEFVMKMQNLPWNVRVVKCA